MYTIGNIFNAISKSKKGWIIGFQGCTEDGIPAELAPPTSGVFCLLSLIGLAESKLPPWQLVWSKMFKVAENTYVLQSFFVEDEIINLGVTDYLLKAVTLQKLQNVLQNALTAPAFLFRSLVHILRGIKQLDFMVALGNHPPLSEESLNRLVGMRGSIWVILILRKSILMIGNIVPILLRETVRTKAFCTCRRRAKFCIK